MRRRLVIIGGVAAGMSAAAKARRVNPELEIVVYEKSGYVSYGACGFPYFIKGEVPEIDDLIVRTPAQMAEQRIEVHVHHEVVEIDLRRRCVRVLDRQTGREFATRWDRLILAAGASVVRPPIPGIKLPGIFTLRTVEDALAIRRWIREEQPRRAVIIGAGYIGLEMAEALRAHQMEVTLVDLTTQVLPALDPEMAAHVQAGLEAHGVTLALGERVTSFIGSRQRDAIAGAVAAALRHRATPEIERRGCGLRVREVVTDSGDLPAELVIFGAGSRPNVELARRAGIKLGSTGAIAVDACQRTSAPDVWAAGAVAEAYHLITHQPTYWPLATVANQQGRVAGTNAADGRARTAGVVGTSVVRAFDLEVAQSGLSLKAALDHGLDAESVTVSAPSRAHYMPGHQPIHVKLVFERGTRRILGAQMVGKDNVGKRIDVVATALRAGWTTEDVAELDLAYSPPFAPVWEPLLVAANIANRTTTAAPGTPRASCQIASGSADRNW